jgi:hypothetical protein
MTTLELDQRLNQMIIDGKSVAALRELYAENVVAQENDEPERVGRDPWVAAREGMEKATKKFAAKLLAHAVHGDVSFSEWSYDLDVEGMGAFTMSQVAVRHWKDGKVIRERFYHK